MVAVAVERRWEAAKIAESTTRQIEVTGIITYVYNLVIVPITTG